jgi:hypothetical protein
MQKSASVLAVLITNQHLLTGEIALGNVRLVEILNDHRTDFLTLTNVRVFQLRSDTPVATLAQAVVRKRNVGLAILLSNEDGASQKRYDRFYSKKRYDTFLIVQGCEVRGQLALKVADDPVTALCHELEGFFPIPEGSVVFGEGHPPYNGEVVIVNRDYVTLVQLKEPVATEVPSAAPRASNR